MGANGKFAPAWPGNELGTSQCDQIKSCQISIKVAQK